jgi:AcrR family transcriptional regulator
MAADQRRAAVVEGAIAVFADDGMHGASMEAVAARAGVPKASCYEAFPSKEALYDAAVAEVDRRLNAALESTYRDAQALPMPDRLRARFAALLGFARREPAAFRLLVLSSLERTPATEHAHERVRTAALDRLAADVRRAAAGLGISAEHTDNLLASVLFGIATGALRAVATDPALDVDAVADLLTEFTIAGLNGISRDALARVAHANTEDTAP